jgi:hypothetical protein
MSLTPGERIVIRAVAMLVAFVIFGLLLFGSFGAEAKRPVRLPVFSIGEVQARCAKVHGVFYNHDGAYGCAFAKGTVQCDGVSHCIGYGKRRELSPPAQQQYVPDYWWHGDRW